MNEKYTNTETCKELVENLIRRMPKPGDYQTPLHCVTMYRRDKDTPLENCIYRPLVLFVIQGKKASTVGNRVIVCPGGHYLLNTVAMPAICRCVHVAEDGAPYLSLAMELDNAVISQLILEAAQQSPAMAGSGESFSVGVLNPDMLKTLLRLVELLDKPHELPVLGPMVIKELHFRLLIGPLGGQLRSIHMPGSQNRQIAWAVSWLKEHFKDQVNISELAKQAHLSEATLHRQFKAITTLSPLQYQKRLRLQEAQKLMVTEKLDAGSASLAVGYESPQQFSREYKRLFGLPPKQDIQRLRP